MKIRIQRRAFVAIIVLWSIAGFQLVAGIMNYVGNNSTEAVFAFRAAIAILSGLLVLESFARRRMTVSFGLLAFSLFWAAYLIRLAHDSIAAPHLLGRPVYIYWTFAIGACLLPALAVALHGSRIRAFALSNWLIGLSTIFLLIAYFTGATTVQTQTGLIYDTGRLMMDSINPIKIGHTAVTALLCIHWRIRFSNSTATGLLVLFTFAVFCALMLFASGSRGPLVALIFGVIFLEAVKGGWSLIFMSLLALVFSPFLVFDMTAIDELLGVTIFSRLDAALSFADASSQMRLAQLNGAWQLFLGNPLFGGALEDPTFRIYPHNLVIEAFMATGIFGGILLILVCIWGLLKAFIGALSSPDLALVGALFVQYLLASQFSSSIWGAYPFWTLFGCVLAFSGDRLRRNDTGPLASQVLAGRAATSVRSEARMMLKEV